MTRAELIRWLQDKTSASAVKNAVGWYGPTRVMTYFDVLEHVAPKRRLRTIDRRLREHARRHLAARRQDA